ncbi:DNA integrity scanning protein DisA nucleotide-binding domain protein [Sandaracinus amylolyticus]|uniref:DNA integrity scanning protein DisA nucleotide-binding domain protein n=1 Tax=Sandaracinus amylolyticus TaxID=927083 RepID=UPI001F42E77D|nr:DNA integrity scanning protein DisA nucleotide-binding domain protein [Sandaracinus amylolyticus]UJR79761.1 Hypothetical protein I5071_17990 [Sandaracinus amylolyticus]
MPYREDPSALDRRRQQLVRRMRDLEARWTEDFWRDVAPERGLQHPGPEPSIEQMAELAARVSALEALEVRHGAVMLEWSTPGAVRRTAHSVRPDDPADPYAAQIAQVLIRHAAPMAIDVRVRRDHQMMFLELAAALPPGVGRFTLGPETLWHSLRKTLGANEIEIGDANFDGAFLIEGDEAAVRAVLDPPTREALLELGALHRAELEVAPGEARVGTAQVDPTRPSYEGLPPLLTVLRSALRAPLRRLRAT